MGNWKQEHGPSWEVPGFIQWLVSKKIIEDHSWHNDSDPQFGIYDENGENGLVLWVAHPMESRREGSTKRFAVQSIKDGEPQYGKDLNTDSLEKAIAEFFDRLEWLSWYGSDTSEILDWLELYKEYADSIR